VLAIAKLPAQGGPGRPGRRLGAWQRRTRTGGSGTRAAGPRKQFEPLARAEQRQGSESRPAFRSPGFVVRAVKACRRLGCRHSSADVRGETLRDEDVIFCRIRLVNWGSQNPPSRCGCRTVAPAAAAGTLLFLTSSFGEAKMTRSNSAAPSTRFCRAIWPGRDRLWRAVRSPPGVAFAGANARPTSVFPMARARSPGRWRRSGVVRRRAFQHRPVEGARRDPRAVQFPPAPARTSPRAEFVPWHSHGDRLPR